MTDLQHKVLVVEDDHAMCCYWKFALERLEVQADYAERAEAAIELARNHRYSLILMDVKLPGKSGLEATEEIREQERRANVEPAIIVAVTGGSASEEACRKAGMDFFFQKPHLLEDVRKILQKTAPGLLKNEDGAACQ